MNVSSRDKIAEETRRDRGRGPRQAQAGNASDGALLLVLRLDYSSIYSGLLAVRVVQRHAAGGGPTRRPARQAAEASRLEGIRRGRRGDCGIKGARRRRGIDEAPRDRAAGSDVAMCRRRNGAISPCRSSGRVTSSARAPTTRPIGPRAVPPPPPRQAGGLCVRRLRLRRHRTLRLPTSIAAAATAGPPRVACRRCAPRAPPPHARARNGAAPPAASRARCRDLDGAQATTGCRPRTRGASACPTSTRRPAPSTRAQRLADAHAARAPRRGGAVRSSACTCGRRETWAR